VSTEKSEKKAKFQSMHALTGTDSGSYVVGGNFSARKSAVGEEEALRDGDGVEPPAPRCCLFVNV
jgi:hypothetical protein